MGVFTVKAYFTGKAMNLSGASVSLKPIAGKKILYPGVSGDVSSDDLIITVKIKGNAVPSEYYDVSLILPAAHTGKATLRIEANALGEAAGYAGYKQATFTIVPDRTLKNVVIEDLAKEIVFSAGAVADGGMTVTGYRAVFAKDAISEELTEGVDFTVSYKNNKKVGKATIVFKGIGRYSGSITKTFKIVPCAAGLVCGYVYDDPAAQTVYYTKGGVTPSVCVTDAGGNVLTVKTDYTVSVLNKSNQKPGEMKLKITGKGNYKGFVTILSGIRIVNGDLGSGRVKLKLTDKVFSSGSFAWKSSVGLTDSNGKALKAGTDYDSKLIFRYDEDCMVGGEEAGPRSAQARVRAGDIIPAGTVLQVVTKGCGNYEGTVTARYKLCKNVITKAKATIASKEYTGSAITLNKADIRLECDGVVLSDDDYEIISYTANIKPGTAKVTVRGTGNYGGEKTLSFKIIKRNIQ